MEKGRKLFCELSPLAYRISVWKCRALRRVRDFLSPSRFARIKSPQPLPCVIARHASLIRRRLGDVDPVLQENKAVNLSLAAPRVSGILIRPGETFSFWRLAGKSTARRGYREGLTIHRGSVGRGIGGGMCQFTNLIHWLALHSPLDVVEHHHHDGVDLFPDFGRKTPFGIGTSIVYNYLDYRFLNRTDQTFQLLAWVEGEYLRGELRAEHPLPIKYHLCVEDEYFSEESDGVYRNGVVIRQQIDRRTGAVLRRETLKINHARVLYDTDGLPGLQRSPTLSPQRPG